MSLAIRDLGARFGSIVALRGATHDFAGGRITAILGPNGAGKTTLLRCLIGALRPSEGSVVLDGTDVRTLPAARRAARLAYAAQRPTVASRLLVREVVELGRYSLAPAPGRVIEAMRRMDLVELGARPVPDLSIGQQHRVALARALAQVERDGWLVLDEPAATLDPAHAMVLVRELRRFAADGGGVVATVHDLTLAATLADAVVLLREGRIVAAGPTSRILRADLLEATFGVPFAELARGGLRALVPVLDDAVRPTDGPALRTMPA